MKNYVEVGRKGLDEHTENTRLEITLSNTNGSIYRSVNYRKMVAAKSGYSSIQNLEVEDPHERFKDYEEDTYIDNSEVFRDTYPPGQEPENVGFFINFGKLKLKSHSPAASGHPKSQTPVKKRKKHHEKERKRTKSDSKHSKPDGIQKPISGPKSENLCQPKAVSPSAAKYKLALSSPHGLVVTKTPDSLVKEHHSREERKKLKKLRREEKKSRKSIEERKSPTKKAKKVDPNVALDKILMSRAKEVKNSEGKVVKANPNYILVPGFDSGIFPFFNMKS